MGAAQGRGACATVHLQLINCDLPVKAGRHSALLTSWRAALGYEHLLHEDKGHARCWRGRGIRREPTACRRRVGTWTPGLQEGCRRHGSSVGDACRGRATPAVAERPVETNRTQEGCPLATEVGRFDTSDQRLATAPDRLQSTDVAQPAILEQVSDLGVAQDGLAQLEPELGAKQALDIRYHDRTRHRIARHVKDHAQTRAELAPRRNGQFGFGGSADKLLMHCALQLIALVRAAVVHGVAVGVAQDFLVGDGQLNDVAELAQGPALKNGKSYAQKTCAQAHRLLGKVHAFASKLAM